MVNEITGQRDVSRVRVIHGLKPEDSYDLAIVLVRKNMLPPVIEKLNARPGLQTVLFMGNNARGFEEYITRLPKEKVLFGFPGVGGGIREQIVHYADREKPTDKRKAVTLGEVDGQIKDRTLVVKSLFESAGVPVDLTPDIDGWLKYHAALVCPLVGALYKHDCDCHQTAQDSQTLHAMVRAAKEGGRVLEALGFKKRQPFNFNLFYWLPEFMSVKAVKGLLESKFAQVVFAMHARAARDEMGDLAREFEELAAQTTVATPNIHALRGFIG